MTLLLLLQTSGFRNCTTFSRPQVCRPLTRAFPRLVSDSRFVEVAADARLPLAAVLAPRCGQCRGLSFLDSTPRKVCHTLRLKSPKVFKDVAQRGVSRTGWFSGCTVPLVLNHQGELLAALVTPGTVEDRQPVPQRARRLLGKLLGDRGSLSHALFAQLWGHGVHLSTRRKKTMRHKLLPWLDKSLLRQRRLIETVHDQLKNICQLEPTRPRRLTNFVVNVLAAVIAYTSQEKKPSLNFTVDELQTLPAVVF